MKFRVLLAFFAGLVISGCGKAPSGSGESDHPPVPENPVSGGTLTVAVQDDAKSLDPHVVTDAASMRMIENLYATLMRYAPTGGGVEPWLARSVDIGPDNLTYTFHLHTNAVFHVSGRGVTAEDVIYSIGRIREKGARADQFAAVADMQAPDPHTLVLHLSEPYAPFLTTLAAPMNAVVDRSIVERHDGRLDQADAGCGPFRLVEWKKDQHLILEKAASHFEPGAPLLDRLVLRPMSDETARTTAFRNGEVDVILDVAARDVGLLERASDCRVETVTGTFWEYVGMNTQSENLKDVRVRRAIALALDRAQLLNLVKFGHGHILSGGPIPPGHWAYLDEDPFAGPQPDAARTLLAEAGVGEGLSLSLKVGSAFPYQVDAAQIVKQQLRAVGITVEIEALESGLFFDSLNQGNFELTLVGWLGFVDPDEWLYNIFHSEGKWNQQGYANPEVDRLLEQGRRISDAGKRVDLYRKAQARIVEEAPMAFLYVNDQIAASRMRVQDFVPHATGTTRHLDHTWLWPSR